LFEMEREKRENNGGVSAGMLELGERIQGQASPGERFFPLPAPTARKGKGIASTMVMGLGLTRKFWNFASVVTLRLVEIFGLGHLRRKVVEERIPRSEILLRVDKGARRGLTNSKPGSFIVKVFTK